MSLDLFHTDMDPYTDSHWQVWVRTPEGGFYRVFEKAYTFEEAQLSAQHHNKFGAHEVPEGSTFLIVEAVTTYTAFTVDKQGA